MAKKRQVVRNRPPARKRGKGGSVHYVRPGMSAKELAKIYPPFLPGEEEEEERLLADGIVVPVALPGGAALKLEDPAKVRPYPAGPGKTSSQIIREEREAGW